MAEMIVTYPAAHGSYVLANWPHPALTLDAAWRPIGEASNAKRFPSELEARSYMLRELPNLEPWRYVVQEAAQC